MLLPPSPGRGGSGRISIGVLGRSSSNLGRSSVDLAIDLAIDLAHCEASALPTARAPPRASPRALPPRAPPPRRSRPKARAARGGAARGGAAATVYDKLAAQRTLLRPNLGLDLDLDLNIGLDLGVRSSLSPQAGDSALALPPIPTSDSLGAAAEQWQKQKVG